MPSGGGEEEIEMWRRRRRRYSAKEMQQKGSSMWEQEPAKKKEKEDRLEWETESESVGSWEGAKVQQMVPPPTSWNSQSVSAAHLPRKVRIPVWRLVGD